MFKVNKTALPAHLLQCCQLSDFVVRFSDFLDPLSNFLQKRRQYCPASPRDFFLLVAAETIPSLFCSVTEEQPPPLLSPHVQQHCTGS